MSDRRAVTAAFIALLATTGIPVGDHKAPVEAAGQPWVSAYAIPGGELLDGNLAGVEHAVDLVYQATSAGRRRDQAEWAADLVRSVMLRNQAGTFVAWPSMPGTLTVVDRQLLGGVGGVSFTDPPHEVFTVVDRYLIRVVRS